MRLTKKMMAVEIASVLFMKPISEDHWKVKDLMKLKHADLADHLKLAEKVKQSRLDIA